MRAVACVIRLAVSTSRAQYLYSLRIHLYETRPSSSQSAAAGGADEGMHFVCVYVLRTTHSKWYWLVRAGTGTGMCACGFQVRRQDAMERRRSLRRDVLYFAGAAYAAAAATFPLLSVLPFAQLWMGCSPQYSYRILHAEWAVRRARGPGDVASC